MDMKRSRKSLLTVREFLEELGHEILCRLPIKDLVRSRCVSKPWRALIDDPDFVRFHLTRFNKSQLLVVQEKFRVKECVLRCIKTLHRPNEPSRLLLLQSYPGSFTFRSNPTCPLCKFSDWNVLYSIDGLFLLKSFDVFVLWNPSIGKTRLLPPSPYPTRPCVLEFGLGFDEFNKDYKFVTFVSKRHFLSYVKCVAVYTVGTNTWKTIPFRGEDIWRQCIDIDTHRTTVCFKGVIYALASNTRPGPNLLVSFDLETEMFASARLPVQHDIYSSSQALTMMDDARSMSLVNLTAIWGSIWVSHNLGAYIKSLTWTQHYTFTFATEMKIPVQDFLNNKIKFLYLRDNGELLFKRRSNVTSYNLETHKAKNVLRFNVHDTWAYMESLVMLTKNIRNV